MNVQSSYLSIAYHIPQLTAPDVPTLDVLSHIFGGTDSSRLEQNIKEKKHLVHHISTYSYTPKDPGLMIINAVLKGKNLFGFLDAIIKEIDILKNTPVTTSELSNAKINIRSNEIYERETVGGEAGKLVTFLACAGTHEFENRYYQMLMDVRTDNVMNAAKQYLNNNCCTLALIVPTKSKFIKQHSSIKSKLSEPIKTKKSSKQQKQDIHIVELKNGPKLIIQENHNLPLVAICAAAKGGILTENKYNNGICELTTRLLTKGTNKRSSIEITKEIEKIAGYIDGFSGNNTIGLRSKFLSDHTKTGIELFCDVLTNPLFDENETKKEINLQLQDIKDQEDALASKAFTNFLKTIFPNHPYGLKTLGETSSVKRITPLSIRKHYRQIINRTSTMISIVGDINPTEVADLLEKNLGTMAKGSFYKFKNKKDQKLKSIIIKEEIKHDKEQAHIVIGFHGTTFGSSDKYALSVLNNILGGQGGRLFLELRDRMGLAYSVSSNNIEGIDPGFLTVYIGTDPAKINNAINGIKTELSNVMAKKVNNEEMERAKEYLIGSYALDSQRLMTLASWYVFNNIYGLGIKEINDYPKHIRSVTKEDVLRVANKYINLNAYVLSIVRPEY